MAHQRLVGRRQRSRSNRRIHRGLLRSLKWLTFGVAMLVFGVQQSDARLHPYSVLVREAADGGQAKPRILFVLDTSGSMATRSQANLDACAWDECEAESTQGTNLESRLALARRAINEVISATGDNAKFGLMTFDQHDPWSNGVPQRCNVGGAWRRFAWVTWSRWFNQAWDQVDRDGFQGAWRLCQGNDTRPYPYLRWDNLGVGSVINSNNAAGAVPDSPLISTAQGDMSNVANANRQVQWFPRFVGVRFQPNNTTDPNHDITHGTTGDYGSNNNTKDVEVWGHDFYYWPYVDGFPGYAFWETYPYYTGEDSAGVIGANLNVQSGKLYAPFYFDFTGIPINPNAEGPASEAEATTAVLSYTSPLIEGGVDAAGYTPWASTIGPIPAAPTQSNAIYAHSTVSSYLAFVNNVQLPDVCAPTAAVLITDGEPYPANEGGWQLYRRLADLRNDLGADVYVVGMYLAGSNELHEMACAGAGACDGNQCHTPCNDTPADAWDTCANPADPANECAFQADSAAELQAILTEIVDQIGDFDVPSGPGSSNNEFGVSGAGGDVDALQTTLSARTEYPSWHGHVERGMCDHRDPGTNALLPECTDPGFNNGDACDDSTECGPGGVCGAGSTCVDGETFGPCPRSRTWDAGECLQLTNWNDRRLYTHDANNQLVPVAEPDGTATQGFIDELTAQNIVGGGSAEADADEIAAFLLGRDAPNDWKLPGLASSAPVIVRRVPPYDATRVPAVAINDPHCGGRLLGAADGVPATLEDYAQDTWDETTGMINLPSRHYEAQEAVVVGDDFGVLHAFGLDSGNELWGFIPRFTLQALADKAAVGAATYGQSGDLEDHSYGLASTINRGWVYDDRDADPNLHRWRLLTILGMGPGGSEYMVLDLSHMSPSSPAGPFEILWTTEDTSSFNGDNLQAAYDQYNGETWARPALGYHVPGETSTQTPEAYFVMGTGYPEQGGGALQGRVLLQVDALTGEIEEVAALPDNLAAGDVYESSFGTVVDPAVGTHCLSRLWAEMQEAYIADPAGRLFRWDLGRETNHAADSGGPWGGAATMALASAIPACEGAGATCTVSSGNPGEPFAFAPAVTSNDRLDDIGSSTTAGPLSPTDQFLVAMIGGSPADDTLRADESGADYQSSLFIMVDDHSGDPTAGFSVPNGAPKAPPGNNDAYMRMALTDIDRTRTIIPYPGAAQLVDQGPFNRGTRPIRAPRIFVTGVVDQATVGGAEPPTVIDGVEVHYIEFTVYEPPLSLCSQDFYDQANNEWYQDPGSTFLVTFRLTTDVASGFDLINGAGGGGGGGGSPADFGAGFEEGLTLLSVEQIGTGDCANGGCGPQVGSPFTVPCDNNVGGGGGGNTSAAVLTISSSELSGFTPVE